MTAVSLQSTRHVLRRTMGARLFHVCLDGTNCYSRYARHALLVISNQLMRWLEKTEIYIP